MNVGVDEKRSAQAAKSAERRVMTVPNQLTAMRLVLSVVLFVLK